MQLIQQKAGTLKTRLVIVLFSIWMLSTFTITYAQEALAPPEIGGQRYYAAFPLTITVDGSFDDWSGVPYATVTEGPQMTEDPDAQASVSFAAVADMDNLYLSFLVTDASIVAGTHEEQYWLEDSIEVYINSTGNSSLRTYTDGVAQLTIPALNIGLPSDEVVLGGTDPEAMNATVIVVATDDGYAVEAAIPLLSDLWEIVPRNGSPLGFQVQLNSASVDDRDVKLSWSSLDMEDDISHLDPSVFGRLEFFQIQGSTIPTRGPSVTPTLDVTAEPTLALSPTVTAEPTAESTDESTPMVTPEATEDSSPAPTATPEVEVEVAGFTVDGSTIFDPNGDEFVTKGVNVSGSNWVWTRPTVPDADLLIDCWNFNLVRVNSFLYLGEVPWAQVDVNNDLDEIVRTFTERGVVVVFEAHDRIGEYYEGEELTDLVTWFTDLAMRYRNNPYVWFDVMNEPGGLRSIDADSWLNVHQQVIQAIRDTAGADNIIIVEGANGGQDAGDWEATPVAENMSAILQYADDILSFNGQDYENIVFSIHPYDQWNSGDARMADFFDRVLARDLALIVGEYAVQTNANTEAAAESVFNTAVPRNIGRIVWHWDGGDANDLTVDTTQGGGWEIDHCESPTNLSWLGEMVWADNHQALPE